MEMAYDIVIGEDFFATGWFVDDYGDIVAISDDNWRNRYVIMQYTGLKDKNGKEIYEHDIIRIERWTHEYICHKCGYRRSSDALAVVVWLDDNDIYPACWAMKIVKTSARHTMNNVYPIDVSDLKDIEVVGNIYENPEVVT